MSKVLLDIKISLQELKNILDNVSKYDHGSEGIIIKSENKRNVRKLFFDNFWLLYPEDSELEQIRANKLEKLKKIYQIDNFDNDVKICNTVSCNGKLVGYDMVSEKINYPYVTTALTKEEKIKFLKQIRNKIENFHKEGIVFGDLRRDNILIDKRKKNISFCDLDNIQIDNNPIDLLNKQLSNFQDENNLIDKKVDCYMYNLLLLQELLYPHYDYDHILKKLSNDSEINIFNETGISNIKKMINCKNKYTGGYLIDNLKK